MDATNEKLRVQFSERLKREFKRQGLPLTSPTNIAGEFNKRYPSKKVVPQTVRKWLGGEAVPTQEKLLSLADWFEVSPQWLRFGTGVRSEKKRGPEETPDIPSGRPELATIFKLLTQLSSSDLKLAENLIRSLIEHQKE
jgi:transcriptional regulator with XRE-family HTH domain